MMRKLFLAASGLFAAIPGLAVLLNGAGLPPGQSALFGGALEAFGALTLLLLWANKSRVRRLKQTTVTKYTLLLAGGAFISLCVYVILIALYVAKAPGRTPVLFPLVSSDSIAALVESAGSRDATLLSDGSAEVWRIIHKTAPIGLAVTTAVLLLLCLAAFVPLTAAFGLVGIKSGADLVEGSTEQHDGIAAHVGGTAPASESPPTGG
jgi:hypothetical protein